MFYCCSHKLFLPNLEIIVKYNVFRLRAFASSPCFLPSCFCSHYEQNQCDLLVIAVDDIEHLSLLRQLSFVMQLSFVTQLLCRCHEVVRQLLGSCHAVVRQLSGSCLAGFCSCLGESLTDIQYWNGYGYQIQAA